MLFKEDWTGAVTSKTCGCRTLDERLRLFNDATVPRIAIRLRGAAANTRGIGARIRVLNGPAR